MEVILIACVSKNKGIGNKGELLFKFPKDMAYFRDTTLGHTVVTGRKTFDAMGKRLLPGRENYIMSRAPWFDVEGAHVFDDVDKVIETAKAKGTEKLFIIGGGEVYGMFMEHYTKLLITEVDAEVEADAFLPDISSLALGDVNLLDDGTTKEGHLAYFMEYAVS